MQEWAYFLSRRAPTMPESATPDRFSRSNAGLRHETGSPPASMASGCRSRRLASGLPGITFTSNGIKVLARLLLVPRGASRRKRFQPHRRACGMTRDATRVTFAFGCEDRLDARLEEFEIERRRWRRGLLQQQRNKKWESSHDWHGMIPPYFPLDCAISLPPSVAQTQEKLWATRDSGRASRCNLRPSVSIF